MIYTEEMQREIESTTHETTATVEVPAEVVDAIAARLDVIDEPAEPDAVDVAHDHVDIGVELVTPDGQPVEEVALGRRESFTGAAD